MVPPILDCLLVTYPIEATHQALFDRLRSLFKTVHFLPGEDGSGTPGPYPVVLPSPEVYAEADCILAFVIPENLLHYSQTPRLKLWHALGSGTHQLTSSPFFRSIPEDNPMVLSNVAGIHATSIGEHVIMTTLMHFHKMRKLMAASNAGHWAGPLDLGGLFIREIRGLTLGIIAYGHIAREIARLASAFGARVIACTRDGKPRAIGGFQLIGTGDIEGIIPEKYFTTEKHSLHEFLGECDVVCNMLPISEQTRHFIGREELFAMKDNALLVNAGRGDTIDTIALIEALQSSDPDTGRPGTLRIGGACLDVTDPEPLPEGHVFYSMENVIITPHCSWASEQLYERVVDLLESNKARIEAGEGALNAIRGKGE